MSGFRYFLALGDIPGDVTDEHHAGQIELVAFSWGLEAAGGPGGSSPVGGGGGAGKVMMDALTAVARTSKASPLIMRACARGEHLRQAVVTVQRPGEQPLDAVVITMSDVVVASYSLNAGAGDVPEDEIALSFARVQFARHDGQAAVTAGWDVTKNTAF